MDICVLVNVIILIVVVKEIFKDFIIKEFVECFKNVFGWVELRIGFVDFGVFIMIVVSMFVIIWKNFKSFGSFFEMEGCVFVVRIVVWMIVNG